MPPNLLFNPVPPLPSLTIAIQLPFPDSTDHSAPGPARYLSISAQTEASIIDFAPILPRALDDADVGDGMIARRELEWRIGELDGYLTFGHMQTGLWLCHRADKEGFGWVGVGRMREGVDEEEDEMEAEERDGEGEGDTSSDDDEEGSSGDEDGMQEDDEEEQKGEHAISLAAQREMIKWTVTPTPSSDAWELRVPYARSCSTSTPASHTVQSLWRMQELRVLNVLRAVRPGWRYPAVWGFGEVHLVEEEMADAGEDESMMEAVEDEQESLHTRVHNLEIGGA